MTTDNTKSALELLRDALKVGILAASRNRRGPAVRPRPGAMGGTAPAAPAPAPQQGAGCKPCGGNK